MSKYEIVWEISLLLFVLIGIVYTTAFFVGSELWFIGVMVYLPYLIFMPKTKEMVGVRVGGDDYNI